MRINVGDLFFAGERAVYPGAWLVMELGSEGSSSSELLMLRPDGRLMWTGSWAWMGWEHFPVEVSDGD